MAGDGRLRAAQRCILGLLAALLIAACGGKTVSVRTVAHVTAARAAPVGTITNSTSAFEATVTWRTNVPSRGYVEYGTSTSYGLWSPSGSVAGTRHVAALHGLVFGQTYHYRVISVNAGGATVGADRVFRTPEPPRREQRTSISRTNQVLVDGHPYFPIMQWLQCPSLFKANVAVGINTFMGQGCSNSTTDEVQQTARVGASSVLPYSSAVRSAPSLLGWRGPDEPDGSKIRPATIRAEFRTNRARDRNHINLLNLSSNFFSQLPPPSWMHGDRSIYKQYTQAADFPGFDIYPIYGWCQPRLIWWEAAAAKEFGSIYARGKPFYSWIEAASTSSQWCTGRGLYPNEVRAEVWMAITNGARGIGYFTHSWTPTYSQFRVSRAVQAEMRRTDRQITNFTEPLLASSAPVSAVPTGSGGPVDFIARRYNGATYVFAVNVGRGWTTERFTGPGLAHRAVTAFEEQRTLRAGASGFTDRFAPLAVHIYIVSPGR